MPQKREFTADQLRAACAGYGYADGQAAHIVWLLSDYLPNYCAGDRYSMCSELGVGWSTLARIANGSYPGDIQPVVAKIERLRFVHALRPGGGLINTCVVDEIHKVLDLSLSRLAVTLIWGTTGRSKTAACKAWTRAKHDCSVYAEVPTIGGIPALMEAILCSCDAGPEYTPDVRACHQAVVKRLEGKVLVVDEVARLFRGDRTKVIRKLDWLRELRDRHGVGLCLVSTEDAVTMLTVGQLKRYCEQLVGRFADILPIPPTVSWREADEIAHGLNSSPDHDLVAACHSIGNSDGKLRTLLEQVAPDALLLAADDRRSLTADDLLAVYADRQGKGRIPAR